jgi:hypothetical protein
MTSCFFAAGGQRREKSAEGAKKQQPVSSVDIRLLFKPPADGIILVV